MWKHGNERKDAKIKVQRPGHRPRTGPGTGPGFDDPAMTDYGKRRTDSGQRMNLTKYT